MAAIATGAFRIAFATSAIGGIVTGSYNAVASVDGAEIAFEASPLFWANASTGFGIQCTVDAVI